MKFHIRRYIHLGWDYFMFWTWLANDCKGFCFIIGNYKYVRYCIVEDDFSWWKVLFNPDGVELIHRTDPKF